MDYKTLLKKYANENYSEFKKRILALPAEKIFENTCKINAYNLISGYFIGEFDLDDNACSFLCEKENKVLDFIYDDYNRYNAYSPESDEDIENFLKNQYE